MSAVYSEPQAAGIRLAMFVCDRTGNEIGTVMQAYRSARAEDQLFVTEWQSQPSPIELLEVDMEAGGAHERLYLPLNAVDRMTGDRVFLTETREGLERSDWRQPPPHLNTLRCVFSPRA